MHLQILVKYSNWRRYQLKSDFKSLQFKRVANLDNNWPQTQLIYVPRMFYSVRSLMAAARIYKRTKATQSQICLYQSNPFLFISKANVTCVCVVQWVLTRKMECRKWRIPHDLGYYIKCKIIDVFSVSYFS